jgi:hypothetical protein
MIVSASYRTDIPAFYGRWFMNRLEAGCCQVKNPYSNEPQEVSLKKEAVDGFVFWTRNLGPFLRYLPEIEERGFPFVVTYTINRYPKQIDAYTPEAECAIDHLKRIAERYGPRVATWRYDTILYSSLTPREFHLENFSFLAERLSGCADEVIISFAQIYQKTDRNLSMAAKEHGFKWWDPPAEEKKSLASELVNMARSNRLRLSVCAQRELLVPGAEDARCIDADRLSEVAGHPIDAGSKGHRKTCGCCQSRDIGAYNTCPHGCVYCYAVENEALAFQKFRDHDPSSESL